MSFSGFLGTVLLLVAFGYTLAQAVKSYNLLVRRQVSVEREWSQITVQLRRRYDLLLNLLRLAEKYAVHERDTLEGVVRARGTISKAETPREAAQADQQVRFATERFFAVAEAYPDLQSSPLFRDVHSEWTDTENKVAMAREGYNHAVGDYNSTVREFPHIAVAVLLGFNEAFFFEETQQLDYALLEHAPRH